MTGSTPQTSLFANAPDANQVCRTGPSEDLLGVGATAGHPGTSVDSIPDDVLVQIFCLVRDATTADNEYFHRRGKSPWEVIVPSGDILLPQRTATEEQWVQITHVCSSWRAAAIGYGSLWSDLSFLTANWVVTALERSRGLPLTITHLQTKDHIRPCDEIRCALGLTHRLRSVKLEIPNSQCLPGLFQRFFGPMPLLQSLELKSVNSWGVQSIARLLVSLDAPQLALLVLEFENTVPWIALAHCHKMVELRVAQSSRSRELLRPLGRVFFPGLEGMASSLQELYLEGCLPSLSRMPDDTPSGPITLPKLMSLTLYDRAKHLVHAFEFLRWPAATHVRIRLTDGDFARIVQANSGEVNLDLEPLNRLLESFKTSTTGFKKDQMRGLKVSQSGGPCVDDSSSVIISMYVAPGWQDLLFWQDLPDWSFEYDASLFGEHTNRLHQEILAAFRGQLGLASIRDLRLNSCMAFEHRQWATLFGELETVTMIEGRVEGLVTALMHGDVKLASSSRIALYLFDAELSLGCYTMTHVGQVMRRYVAEYRPDLRLEISQSEFYPGKYESETCLLLSPK